MVILDEYLDFVVDVQRYFGRFGDEARVIKVQEEAGEVAEAFLHWKGYNPWKEPVGVGEVVQELADVILTALVGIVHFGFDPNDALETARKKTEERMRDHHTT